MRSWSVLLVTTIGTLAGATTLRAAGQGEALNSASWWIATYGLMESSDPLARRSEAVFHRVAAAADKRSSRLPKLVLLRRPDRPQAIALPDGSITVTRAAIRLCYREGRDRAGDAKLAFVLGHELSHLASDDFWHRAAFAFVRERSQEAERVDLGSLLGGPGDQEARELEADAHGIIYATLAGYDPGELFAKSSFIAEWVGQLSSVGYSVVSRVDANQRAETLRRQLDGVAEELDAFHFGVRLLQLGRYTDALTLLERFRIRFPGREVLNDIGLAHLKLALSFLAKCDNRQYLTFKLPLVADPGTLASATRFLGPVPQLRAPGAQTFNCVSSDSFHGPLSEAVRSFQLAKERDPSYLPAYQNLATAHLISGAGTGALYEANAALAMEPGNHEARLQRAVALYVMGPENGLNAAVQAIDELEALQSAEPASPEVAYNLAQILSQVKGDAGASQAWRRFLELEPSGSYAAEARRHLSSTAAPLRPDRRTPPARRKLPSSPIPLGSRLAAVVNGQTTVRSIREGSFRGSVLRNGGISALAIDDVVEVVDVQTQSSLSPLDVYGPPERVEKGRSGDLYFYSGVMVEWSAGRPRTEVFFRVSAQASSGG